MSAENPLFNTDVTIFNLWRSGSTSVWVRSHVYGVSWYGQKGGVLHSGSEKSSFVVRVCAPSLQSYVSPQAFAAAGEAPKNVWTAQAGDVVVKGIVADSPSGITDITKKYHDCFVVSAVADNRRIALKHIRIEGG